MSVNVESVMDFSDIASHPLFKTERLDGVMNAFTQSANSTLLGPFIPFRTVNSDVIEMDIDVPQRGGMTPLATMGSAAPMYHIGSGRQRRKFEAPVWKEKVSIQGHELYDLRELGTKEGLKTATSLLADKIAHLEERLVNRMEWSRRQFLFDQQVVGQMTNGQQVVFNYSNHASYMRVTAGVLWSNVATADPIDDIMQWAETYRRYSPFKLDTLILPIGTMRRLTKLERFRDIMNSSHGSFNGSSTAIKAEFQAWGFNNIMESDESINSLSRVMATVSNGDTAITVENASMLEANDIIEITNVESGERELLTVVSVASNVITVSAPGVARTAGYAAGDLVGWNKYIIPENKALILGVSKGQKFATTGNQAAIDRTKIDNFAAFTSTIARDSDLKNPKPGVFRKTIDKTNDDPAALYQILGVQGLIEMFEGRAHMVATIF